MAARGLPLPVVPVVSLTYLYTVLWVAAWLVLGVTVLGFTPVAITSGSMSPAIRPGDVVLELPPGPEPLAPPNVITFQQAGDRSRTVTHRITGINPDGTLQTRGDANPAADSDPVEPSEVLGVGRLLLPFAALPAVWARTGQIVPLALWAAGSVLALAAAGRALRGGTREPGAARRRRAPVHPPTRRSAPSGATAPRPAPAAASPLWSAHHTPGGAHRRRGGRAARRRASALRAGRAVGAAGALLAALLSLNLALPPGQAAFASTTASSGNAFEATTVLPPTDVTAEFDCGLLGVGKGNLISWTASVTPEADGYEIWKAVGTGSFTLLTTVGTGTTSYKDTDVQNSTTYHYVVRTTVGTWTSGDSNQASVTTPGTLSCPL